MLANKLSRKINLFSLFLLILVQQRCTECLLCAICSIYWANLMTTTSFKCKWLLNISQWLKNLDLTHICFPSPLSCIVLFHRLDFRVNIFSVLCFKLPFPEIESAWLTLSLHMLLLGRLSWCPKAGFEAPFMGSHNCLLLDITPIRLSCDLGAETKSSFSLQPQQLTWCLTMAVHL